MQLTLKTVVMATVVVLGIAEIVLADDATQNSKQKETSKILFIGNSYTYYNSLDGMVEAMLNVSGVPAEAQRSAPGGWRLRQHFNGEVPKKRPEMKPTPDWIKSSDWDFVVLQEQSAGAVAERAEFLEFGKKLCDMIHENCPDAKVLLYQTWGRCDGMFDGYGDDESRKAEVLAAWEKRYSAPNDATVEALKDGMQGGYAALAAATGATVVPVGKAFKEAGDKVDLHADEKEAKPHHPSPAGTYLGACVFFKTITGQSPKGLWEKLNAADKDFKVSKEDASYLEDVADKVVK